MPRIPDFAMLRRGSWLETRGKAAFEGPDMQRLALLLVGIILLCILAGVLWDHLTPV